MFWFFNCTHPRLSFPIKINGITRRSCLDCAKTFIYDFDNMKLGDEVAEIPKTLKQIYEESRGV